MKSYLYILIFVLFFGVIWIIVYFGKRPDIYITEIRKGYKGIVADKFEKRTIILKIRTEEREILEVGILCDELKEKAEIGDSIEKVPNENFVFLRKKGNILKLSYIYISQNMREDRRWPIEWKDKWKECPFSRSAVPSEQYF